MATELDFAPEGVRQVLALAGWPERRMELECRPAGMREAEEALRGLDAEPAVLAGLWLYCGRFEESHGISQELNTAEGSYWHAILHRQEPDDWNSGYWFRRVGRHPIFGELAARAKDAGYGGGEWDAEGFIRYCAAARKEGGQKAELARRVQHIEFGLLMAWSLRRGKMK
jgi:hypothetical protein